MEDSFIIANFHALCRLCLNKSILMVSIFATVPEDDAGGSVMSQITNFLDIQIDPNDGLPSQICYKCLFNVNKCSEFKMQCIQSETRLRQFTSQLNILENSNSSELNSYNYESIENMPKTDSNFIVEDRVVMVVDPSLDYDSSDGSDNNDQMEQEANERSNTPEGEPISFFKNVFMCQYCDQAFISHENCKEHEDKYHDPNLPYKCVSCSLVFGERNHFVQHNKIVHGNEKPYHCPECDKCFGRRSDLRKHSIVHTGIRPYQCQYCFKSFSRNTNLSKHLRIHQGVKPHVCPMCPRSFVAKGDLQRHILVHSGMKPYACTKCPITFGRRDKLVKHELSHGDINPDLKTNEYDNEQEVHDMVVNINPFSNLTTSVNHDVSNTNCDLPSIPDHITGENSFQNQINKYPKTSAKCTQNAALKHKSIKNKPKNIKCHQCTKRFSSLDAYKTHVSVAHIGSRVFQCKICFKKFTRKRELDRHNATTHCVDNSFSCNQCDQKFIKKENLDQHESSHECLVVNMPCIECGATFERKSDLVAHIKSHFTENFDTKSDNEIKKEDETQFPLDVNFYDLET